MVKRVCAAALVIIAGITGLLLLQGLIGATHVSTDPTATVNPMLQDNINGYGLDGGQKLSELRIGEVDNTVIYSDRVVRHFEYREENLNQFALALRGIRRHCPGVSDIYVVPALERFIIEPDFSADHALYRSFIDRLRYAAARNAVVIDPSELLAAHSDEYVFYRTEAGWAARGAYYVSTAICDALGVEPIPLEEYEEHYYKGFKGSLLIRVSADPEMEALIESYGDIPNDASFFYLLPGSRNIEELMTTDDELIKTPVISKARTGRGMFIGSTFRYAVLPGDGMAKDSPLASENVLLICDADGTLVAPYLANYCGKLYVANIEWYRTLADVMPELVSREGITKVIIIQCASEIGSHENSAALNKFMD